MADKTVARPPPQPLPELDARFKVVKTLGTGGMGAVYLAQDRHLHRLVAIKTIRPELCAHEEVRQRINRECRLHAKLGVHPHIVALFDRLEYGSQINLVMEYVAGQTLQDWLQSFIDKGINAPWQISLTIVSQCLEALAWIHSHGVIHRDIKPSNVLIACDAAGRYHAKLMDFGIARPQVQNTALTRYGSSGPGTPLYMAPEQIDPTRFGEITPAVDLYAIGILLYQLLTGKLPFNGTLTEVLIAHVVSPPPPLVLDHPVGAALDAIVQRALQKYPADRFSSAVAFREAIEQVLGHSNAAGVVAQAPTAGGRSDKTIAFHPTQQTWIDPVTDTSMTHGMAETAVASHPLSQWGMLGSIGTGITMVLLLGIGWLLTANPPTRAPKEPSPIATTASESSVTHRESSVNASSVVVFAPKVAPTVAPPTGESGINPLSGWRDKEPSPALPEVPVVSRPSPPPASVASETTIAPVLPPTPTPSPSQPTASVSATPDVTPPRQQPRSSEPIPPPTTPNVPLPIPASVATAPLAPATQTPQTPRQPAQTPRQPAQTSRQPAQTPRQPAQTSRQPAQTSRQPTAQTSPRPPSNPWSNVRILRDD